MKDFQESKPYVLLVESQEKRLILQVVVTLFLGCHGFQELLEPLYNLEFVQYIWLLDYTVYKYL